MKRMVGIAALAAITLAGAAGCTMGGGEDDGDPGVHAAVTDIAGGAGIPIVMCRSIERRLRGLEAAIFQVIDYENLVAVKAGGEVVCVDDKATVRNSGVIPRTDSEEPPCTFCDGTPLPASFLEDTEEQ
jgi:hypothetical protein